jgi:hypothetical protein
VSFSFWALGIGIGCEDNKSKNPKKKIGMNAISGLFSGSMQIGAANITIITTTITG